MSNLSITLVGLPFVGKTVIFNLVTRQAMPAGSRPAPTGKPSRGVATVQDDRMQQIAEIILPAELFPLQVDITDTAGIIEGVAEERGGGGSQEGLSAFREADVLAHVVRGFQSPNVPYLFDTLNYERDASLAESELIRADLATVKREIQKIEKLRLVARQGRESELVALRSVSAFLDSGQPLRTQQWPDDTVAIFKQLNLITHRPQFYVINYGEDEIPQLSDMTEIGQGKLFHNAVVGTICSQLEYEMDQLPESEREEFQALYPSLRLTGPLFPWWAIRALKMVTYFTFGQLGLKEWAIPEGSTASGAAKRLHTDIAKGLIATEVFSTTELLDCGSVEEVKRQGKLRVEGRDYQIQDGDILYFRFSK